MPKNIAVFVDGTWNDARMVSPTNVHRLFAATAGTEKAAHDLSDPENLIVSVKEYNLNGKQQVSVYLRGVGTQRGWIRERVDGALGFGVIPRIKAGYGAICKYYDPGDRLYIFGFSRGAYIARCLANFAGYTGLLLKQHVNTEMIDRSYKAFSERRITKSDFRRAIGAEVGKQGGSDYDDREIEIHLLRLWDCVRMAILRPRNDPDSVPEYITHARHCLAIHEFRKEFSPTIWSGVRKESQSLQQAWFPGAHGDVGGGYINRVAADHTLCWMYREAMKLGLLFREFGAVGIAKESIEGFHLEWADGLFSHEVRSELQAHFREENPAIIESFRMSSAALATLLRQDGLRVFGDFGELVAPQELLKNLLSRADQSALDLAMVLINQKGLDVIDDD